ncbi:hypothetical protein GGI35DRAFT_445651 [Trichoderma velutinum]
MAPLKCLYVPSSPFGRTICSGVSIFLLLLTEYGRALSSKLRSRSVVSVEFPQVGNIEGKKKKSCKKKIKMEFKRRGRKEEPQRENPHMSRRLLCTGDLFNVYSLTRVWLPWILYSSYPSMQSDVML